MRIPVLILLLVLVQTTLHAQFGDEPFTYVEKMPEFHGGTDAMHAYIRKHLIVPEQARKNGVSGQVVVQFIVNTDSTTTPAKVLRGLSDGCNEEAIRVVDQMNREHKWNPGTHVNRPVRVYQSIPVKFPRS